MKYILLILTVISAIIFGGLLAQYPSLYCAKSGGCGPVYLLGYFIWGYGPFIVFGAITVYLFKKK